MSGYTMAPTWSRLNKSKIPEQYAALPSTTMITYIHTDLAGNVPAWAIDAGLSGVLVSTGAALTKYLHSKAAEFCSGKDHSHLATPQNSGSSSDEDNKADQ